VTTFRTATAIGSPEPGGTLLRSLRVFPGVSGSGANRFTGRTLIRLSRNSAHEPGLRPLPNPGVWHSATARLSPVSPKAVSAAAKTLRPAVPTVTPAGGNQ
jgi:hypothetical protein